MKPRRRQKSRLLFIFLLQAGFFIFLEVGAQVLALVRGYPLQIPDAYRGFDPSRPEASPEPRSLEPWLDVTLPLKNPDQLLIDLERGHSAVTRPVPGSEDKPGAVRIVCVGDSMTYGLGVEEGDAYPAQLQERFNQPGHPPVTVINYGNRGLNTIGEVLLLHQNFETLHPGIIVWQFTENDVEPVMNYAAREAYRKLPPARPWMEWSGLYRLYFWGWRLPQVLEDSNRITHAFYKSGSRALRGFERSMERLRNLTQPKGIPVFFFYYPEMLPLGPLYQGHVETVETIAAKAGFTILPVRKSFEPLSDQELLSMAAFAGDFHPGRKGHGITADTLFTALEPVVRQVITSRETFSKTP